MTTRHLADGPHAFSVRATDPAGNLGRSLAHLHGRHHPANHDDHLRPVRRHQRPDPDLQLLREPGATLQCRLDSTQESAWRGCSSTRTLAHLSDGSHSFEVRATDAAQNVGSPASRTFIVDTAEVSVAGSTLTVTAATGAKDDLRITKPSPTTLRITDLPSARYAGSGVHTGAGCTRSGDYTANCTASGITLIRALAADQADQLTNSTALVSALNGGPGDDTLTGGSVKDTLTGAAGADVMRGMNGNDLLKARDLTSDRTINCDGGGTPGRADKADLDLLPKTPTPSSAAARRRRATRSAASILEKLDAPDRTRTSASPEGERCHRFDPGEAGRARQDSNLSEPGGRAVSQVRSWRSWTRPTGFEPQRAWRASGVTGSILEKLDAPDRIRTCDLRFRRFTVGLVNRWPSVSRRRGSRVASRPVVCRGSLAPRHARREALRDRALDRDLALRDAASNR